MTAAISSTSIALRHQDVFSRVRRGRLIAAGAFALTVVYIIFSLFQFDLPGVARRWDPMRAAMFTVDLYAHKDHIMYEWEGDGNITVAFEGGYRHVYDEKPIWMSATADGGTVVNFDGEGQFVIFPDRVEMRNWPDTDQNLTVRRGADGRPYVEGFVGRSQDLPEWINVTENKVEARPSLFERLQVYPRKVEIHRYEMGWKYFWFDFDSPLVNMGFIEGVRLMFSDQPVRPGISNFDLVISEFWNNSLWQHGIVLVALLETLLMAILGTAIAALLGLPLAFVAARNVSPVAGVRFITRRLFDLLRGIDMLIWSLIFLRAFGPGLFTGIFAIGFTDTGTLGKLMSEAIENADRKEVDGVKSVGASKLQQHRFGIIPQILPIFVSQSLYYLESNTRSAVIIGAMGAGGIGLQFLGALQTGNDFENVAYMAILILIMVIIMDTLSSRLRRALIKMDTSRT